MAARQVITTQVAIVGGGPAGLMLSHLLAKEGIESTVVEMRSRQEIAETVRAGILEHGTVNLLVDSDVSDRVLRDGDRHDGIELRFNGESHRIDFQDLVGESVWLYPQTDVFMDLVDAVRPTAATSGTATDTTSTASRARPRCGSPTQTARNLNSRPIDKTTSQVDDRTGDCGRLVTCGSTSGQSHQHQSVSALFAAVPYFRLVRSLDAQYPRKPRQNGFRPHTGHRYQG